MDELASPAVPVEKEVKMMSNNANEVVRAERGAALRSWSRWTMQILASGLTGVYYLLKMLGKVP
jgi:hypothetical protein